MKCAVITIKFHAWNDEFEVDHLVFDREVVSDKWARDIYFHTLLHRVKYYSIPNYVDIVYLGEEDDLRTIVRFIDQSALYAELHFVDLSADTDTDDPTICAKCPAYDIKLGYWAETICFERDYTRSNFLEIVEKWLLGEYVTR